MRNLASSVGARPLILSGSCLRSILPRTRSMVYLYTLGDLDLEAY